MERHRLGKGKKRQLKDLDCKERVALAKLYLSGAASMEVVAAKHHINAQTAEDGS